jgi:hypothetical protein
VDFAWRDWRKPEKHQSRQLVFCALCKEISHLMQQLLSGRSSASKILWKSEFSVHMVGCMCIYTRQSRWNPNSYHARTWSTTSWSRRSQCYCIAVLFITFVSSHHSRKEEFGTYFKNCYFKLCNVKLLKLRSIYTCTLNSEQSNMLQCNVTNPYRIIKLQNYKLTCICLEWVWCFALNCPCHFKKKSMTEL